MKNDSVKNYFKNRVSISVVFFASGFAFASWASRIPFIQNQLGISNGILGLILLGIPVGALGSIPFSNLINRNFPSYRITLVSLATQLICLCGIGWSLNPFLLTLFLFLYGFFSNLTNIAMNVQAVNLEEKMNANIMSSFHGYYSLANMAGAFLGGFLGLNSVLPGNHFILVCVILIVLVSLLGRNLLKTDQKSTINPVQGQKEKFSIPPLQVIYLGIIAFCVMLTEGSVADWSGIYFKTQFHIIGGLNAAGYTAFALTMAVNRFSGEWIIDRLGARKTILYSGLLIAIGLTLVLSYPLFEMAIFGFGLVGMGCATVVPIVYSSVGKIKTIEPSKGLGLVTIIGYVGFLSGPPAIGLLAQAFSLRIAFFLVLALGITIALLSKLVPDKKSDEINLNKFPYDLPNY